MTKTAARVAKGALILIGLGVLGYSLIGLAIDWRDRPCQDGPIYTPGGNE